jgi:hypothetical protein
VARIGSSDPANGVLPFGSAMVPLHERLRDWTDFDRAEYELGAILGMFQENPRDSGGAFRQFKWVFCSNNPLGNALHEMLEHLAKIGVLERNDDGYRWNPQGVSDLLDSKQ